MRINQFLARHTTLSRRQADTAVSDGRVEINGILAALGDTVIESDKVLLDGMAVKADSQSATIMLNKPVGYVCSRNGQGNPTVFELLPKKYQHLNPVGRLDKNSSGLLILTNDGDLANKLAHPSYNKQKIYEVKLNKQISPADMAKVSGAGVDIDEGRSSKFKLEVKNDLLICTLTEGRNRQIRRTFEALGYKVSRLHRTQFGDYALDKLKPGQILEIY